MSNYACTAHGARYTDANALHLASDLVLIIHLEVETRFGLETGANNFFTVHHANTIYEAHAKRLAAPEESYHGDV